MALFIQPENQNILWEMVNRVPICNTVFPLNNISQMEKKNWFKGIIEEFYRRLPANIDRNELYKVNREVLSKMVRSLGDMSIHVSMDRGIFSQLDANINSKPKQTDYEIRQAQYTSMFENKKPDTIDFSEKLDDGVITNMDELIDNQRKMRELEVQQFSPILQTNKVNILEDVPKESIQSHPIEQKHVRFDFSTEKIYSDETQSTDLLFQKIENMDEKISKILIILNRICESDNQSATVDIVTIKQMMESANQLPLPMRSEDK